MSCPSANSTIHVVDRCPRNALEWAARADLFNCSSFHQTCVSPNKFVYHCVLNADGTKLLEVCAPYKYIHGQLCVEFDTKGSIIQENAYDCSNSTVPCPNVYKSTDAFNYQGCYDEVEMKREAASINHSITDFNPECSLRRLNSAALSITNIITFVICIILCAVYFKNNRFKVLDCKTKKPKTSSTCTPSETREESQSSEPLHNSCAIPIT